MYVPSRRCRQALASRKESNFENSHYQRCFPWYIVEHDKQQLASCHMSWSMTLADIEMSPSAAHSRNMPTWGKGTKHKARHGILHFQNSERWFCLSPQHNTILPRTNEYHVKENTPRKKRSKTYPSPILLWSTPREYIVLHWQRCTQRTNQNREGEFFLLFLYQPAVFNKSLN